MTGPRCLRDYVLLHLHFFDLLAIAVNWEIGLSALSPIMARDILTKFPNTGGGRKSLCRFPFLTEDLYIVLRYITILSCLDWGAARNIQSFQTVDVTQQFVVFHYPLHSTAHETKLFGRCLSSTSYKILPSNCSCFM